MPRLAPGRTLLDALGHYDGLLACNPWLPGWPLAFSDASVMESGDGKLWAVSDDTAVPLEGETALLLRGMQHLDLYGTFDGRQFHPLAANSKLGPLWSHYR